MLMVNHLVGFGAFSAAAGVGNDANTMFLLHCDGTDGSTTITDSSTGGAESPHTQTAVADAQIDTAQSKFGGASLLFDGTGDRVTSPDSNDYDFSGDFTVDFWMRPATVGTSVMIANCDANNGSDGWHIAQSGATGLLFAAMFSGGWGVYSSKTHSMSADTWYHIAIVRSGSTITWYQDGTSIGTSSYGSAITSSRALQLGANPTTNTELYNGHLDEVRISNIARWTANFTPPTSAYG